MTVVAKLRGLEVTLGVVGFLLFKRKQFDLALIVTALVFFKNLSQVSKEVLKFLKPGWQIITEILDRDSPLGRCLESGNKKGRFLSEARFLSAAELSTYLLEIGFENLEVCQTLFKSPEKITKIETQEKGHGRGWFAVLFALKPLKNPRDGGLKRVSAPDFS